MVLFHEINVFYIVQGGIGSAENADHVLVALEPEAASIYCRKLKMNQIVSERPRSIFSRDLM